MTAVADPSELYCWWKDRNPSTVIMCSCAEKLCKFKHKFFVEWPEYLLNKINKTEMLLDCDTLERYSQLMDIIFSVKYIERAFELKAKVDNTLLNVHPPMTYIVT